MIFTTDDAVSARIAPLLPRGFTLYRTGERADLLGDGGPAWAVKLSFDRIPATAQTGRAARLDPEFTLTVFVDKVRARDEDKAAAEAFFLAALKNLVGWESAPGRETRLTDGPPTEDEAGVVAFSFGFAIPTFVTQL